jgi:hypothetical protein
MREIYQSKIQCPTSNVISALFRQERRIYPAEHSITRTRCRMNAAFRRSAWLRPALFDFGL